MEVAKDMYRQTMVSLVHYRNEVRQFGVLCPGMYEREQWTINNCILMVAEAWKNRVQP